jgi:Fe2+ or Zn2+ uptake regulation protein
MTEQNAESAADRKPDTTTRVLCEECGTVIEVSDAAALIRALHLSNACGPMQQVLGEPK